MKTDEGKSDGSRQASKRGFASMDESKQREIASKGGKAAHEKGTAHEFNSEEARKAGKKGGASHRKAAPGSSASASVPAGVSEQHVKTGGPGYKTT
jgi:uncharacterized protein